jgi:tetratricopeptide (TPR) repeat protein
VAVAAVAIRAAALLSVRDLGFISGHLSDAAVYWQESGRLARGQWLASPDFVHAPLYAYILAVLRLASGDNPFAPRVVHIAFSALACVLVMLAGRRFFGLTAGVAAGLLMAAVSPAVFADLLIQKTSLEILLSSALLWTAGAWAAAEPERRTPRQDLVRAAVAGAALGLLTLSRQNALVLAPLLALWVWVRSSGSPRDRAAACLALLAAMTITLMPWAIRNRAVTGEFVLTTPNLGQNFAMGNLPEATGTYLPMHRGRASGEVEQDAWTRAAERAAGRSLSPREVSSHYLARSLEFIASEPGSWLALMGRKWLMTWGAYEWPDTEDLYLYIERSPPLRACDAVMHFGVLAPLAGAGLVLTWRDRRRAWLLYGWVGLVGLSIAAFVVFGRYRAPLLPVLAVLGGAVMPQVIAGVRRKADRPTLGWRIVLVAVGAGLLAAWVSNGWLSPPRRARAFSHINHAVALANTSRYGESLAALDLALALEPFSSEARAVRGSVLLDLGRALEALAEYERVRRDDPTWSGGPRGIGNALLALGRADEAAAQFEAALALDPDDRMSACQLGASLAHAGRLDEALAVLTALVQREPRFAEARLNLGNVHLSRGDSEAAEQCYRSALEVRPDDVDAMHNLAALLAADGRVTEARRLLMQVLRLSPGSGPARDLLQRLPPGEHD